MIGNDIVDLGLAKVQSNWRRKRFLEKVFSSNEQAMIFRSEKPDNVVWRLWSMKESAYKAHLRIQKRIQINPRSFDCQFLSEHEGIVICDTQEYHTLTEINNNYLHTRAYKKDFSADLFSKVIAVEQNQSSSSELYNKMLLSVAAIMNWEKESTRIEKNYLGIPELYRFGKRSSVLCSLSHHGRYGSYLTGS